MKIYLVTVGQYSDYRVVGVYTTKARARRIASAIDDGMVETLTANEAPNFVERGYFLWYVRMARNGNTSRAYATGLDSYSTRGLGFKGTNIAIEYNREYARIHCWARTKKAAIKIANELRAQKIANNEWLPPDPQRCGYLPPSQSYGPHSGFIASGLSSTATEGVLDFWKIKV